MIPEKSERAPPRCNAEIAKYNRALSAKAHKDTYELPAITRCQRIEIRKRIELCDDTTRKHAEDYQQARDE